MFSQEVQRLIETADRARTEGDAKRAIDLYAEALDRVGNDEAGRRSIRLLRGLTLVEREDFEGGVEELTEVLPGLKGRELIEAHIGLSRASMWLERTDDSIAFAERSLELAERSGDAEMRGPALGVLSQVYGQRGREGDLGRAVHLGDLALEAWVPDTRSTDLAGHEGLHALTHYWSGGYEKAVELGRRGGDGATAGLALTALGRHEEAIDVFDAAIANQRELDLTIGTAYALNCSTAVLRDLFDLTEARRRNEEGAELFRKVDFESGVMQSEIDLLYTDLVGEDAGSAAQAWPGLWDRLPSATGWERWLAPGRLSVANAEIELRKGRWERAVDAAREAIEIAREIGRTKYEVSARITLGAALNELDQHKDAIVELRAAAAGADRLGHPPTRWHAHAELAGALLAAGDDEGAEAEMRAAFDIVRRFSASLRPEHAEAVLASREVREILAAG